MTIHRQSHDDQSESPKVALTNWIMGSLVTQLIYVVARLGIADSLTNGSMTAQQLAKAYDVDADVLYRILRTLASVEIFSEDEEARFSLTPIAELLASDSQDSLRYLSILKGIDYQWNSQGALLHQVRTGEIAFDHCFKQDYFKYLQTHDIDREIFDHAMTDMTRFDLNAIVAGYDFSDIGTIVDVGGGEGALIAGILEAYPSMRGVVADLVEVLGRTKQRLASEGLAERCETVETDFFRAVPPGGDAYIMRKVIHDWDDDKACTILANCRAEMKKGARLLVIESVVPTSAKGTLSKLNDIEIMIYVGGRERTELEYRSLFNAAGFKLLEIVPTESPSSILVGHPI